MSFPRYFSFQKGTPTKMNEQKIVKEDKNVKVKKKRKLADVEDAVSHKSPKKKKKKKESGYGSSLQLDDVRNCFCYLFFVLCCRGLCLKFVKRYLKLHQSTNCNQKHGGFWPNLRYFDVTVSLFSCRTPLTRYLSGKNLSMSRGQWMAP